MLYHRKTTEQFVKEAMQVHGGKFDYSKTEFTNTSLKIQKHMGHFLLSDK